MTGNPEIKPSIKINAVLMEIEPKRVSENRKSSKYKNWWAAEDRALLEAVSKVKPGNWKAVAKLFSGRSAKQCRQRWTNHVRPSKHAWSKEEDIAMIALVKKFGSRWSTIAQHLRGRTDRAIKNRYFTFVRHKVPRPAALGLPAPLPTPTMGPTTTSSASTAPASLSQQPFPESGSINDSTNQKRDFNLETLSAFDLRYRVRDVHTTTSTNTSRALDTHLFAPFKTNRDQCFNTSPQEFTPSIVPAAMSSAATKPAMVPFANLRESRGTPMATDESVIPQQSLNNTQSQQPHYSGNRSRAFESYGAVPVAHTQSSVMTRASSTHNSREHNVPDNSSAVFPNRNRKFSWDSKPTYPEKFGTNYSTPKQCHDFVPHSLEYDDQNDSDEDIQGRQMQRLPHLRDLIS